mmetsp:Transcript_26696/g.64677  ORF Transcript_26696/g.64677 Transcript_26696/m.64677 type:complete len:183 (+) Transcript_26696:1578-2126(+)
MCTHNCKLSSCAPSCPTICSHCFANFSSLFVLDIRSILIAVIPLSKIHSNRVVIRRHRDIGNKGIHCRIIKDALLCEPLWLNHKTGETQMFRPEDIVYHAEGVLSNLARLIAQWSSNFIHGRKGKGAILLSTFFEESVPTTLQADQLQPLKGVKPMPRFLLLRLDPGLFRARVRITAQDHSS